MSSNILMKKKSHSDIQSQAIEISFLASKTAADKTNVPTRSSQSLYILFWTHKDLKISGLVSKVKTFKTDPIKSHNLFFPFVDAFFNFSRFRPKKPIKCLGTAHSAQTLDHK